MFKKGLETNLLPGEVAVNKLPGEVAVNKGFEE